MDAKFLAIDSLLAQLRAVEEDYCWAMRQWGRKEEADDLFVERGEIIRALQQVY